MEILVIVYFIEEEMESNNAISFSTEIMLKCASENSSKCYV